MSTFLAAILALAITSDDSNGSETANTSQKIVALPALDNKPVFAARKPAEMRTAVSAAMRATATGKDAASRDQAIRQLILVLLELEQDQNLTHDERVELHAGVRSRLMTLVKSLQAEAERAKRTPSLDIRQEPDALKQRDSAQQPLAQIVVPAAAGRIPIGGGANAGRVGVFGGAVAGTSNQPQQTADYGPDLVNLIQTVIAPRTWDVNGGPGSVVYYRNLRALVVRAPSEVHDQLGDVLGQLRK